MNIVGKDKKWRKKLTLLDVVVSKGTTILKLLSGEDEALLIRRNSYSMFHIRSPPKFTYRRKGLGLDHGERLFTTKSP
jgi:hypothetical protein